MIEATITEAAFIEALGNAVATGAALQLGDEVVRLTASVKLKRREKAIIQGGTIVSHGHSIFQVDSTVQGSTDRPTLSLARTTLHHVRKKSARC